MKEAAWMWCEKREDGLTPTGKPKFRYIPLESAPVIYCADHPEKPCVSVVSPNSLYEWGWRKKIGRFLPAWAVRIQLEIVGRHVEFLNDITDEDALAEGVTRDMPAWRKEPYPWSPHLGFAWLWESINGPGSWADNPPVWVVEFKRVKP